MNDRTCRHLFAARVLALVGWAEAKLGLGPTFLLLALVGLEGVLMARWSSLSGNPVKVVHNHPDLRADRSHLR